MVIGQEMTSLFVENHKMKMWAKETNCVIHYLHYLEASSSNPESGNYSKCFWDEKRKKDLHKINTNYKRRWVQVELTADIPAGCDPPTYTATAETLAPVAVAGWCFKNANWFVLLSIQYFRLQYSISVYERKTFYPFY